MTIANTFHACEELEISLKDVANLPKIDEQDAFELYTHINYLEEGY